MGVDRQKQLVKGGGEEKGIIFARLVTSRRFVDIC